MNKQKLTKVEEVWVTEFDREFRRVMKRRSAGEDISGDQTVDALQNIRQVMARYPDPARAVRAMNYTARVDYNRNQAKQRGEGLRHGRIVQRFPTGVSDDGRLVPVDIIDQRAMNPEVGAILRDECKRFLSVMKPVVAKGFVLTSIAGFDQAGAAEKIGVTREYLCRQMKQSRNAILENLNLAA
jgi:hypothetical protein